MKKSINIFVVLIFLLSLSSCGVLVEKPSEEIASQRETNEDITEPLTFNIPEPKPTLSSDPEITSENIFNNGSCAIQDDRIYFCNSYDGGTLYSIKTDGSDMLKLNDDWTQWFNVTANQIYYENGNGRICAMNIDGSGQQKLNDDNSSNINVVGGRIYYSNMDDGFKLYSMNTDGSDRKKLNDDIPLYMNVVGDRIYYSGDIGAKGIYSVKLDGSEKTKLSDDKPFQIVVTDGWIYYNNQNDDYKLYVMRIDGSERHKLIDDYAPRMSVVSDRIYYVKGDEWKIYSVKTDGSERQLLSDDNAQWFGIRGDSIYYTISGAKIYSMNIDGSDKKLLVELDKDAYKNVTYEVSSRLHESMPEYRFVATGLASATDTEAIGYIIGLEVYDENNTPILSEDFSEYFDDIITGYPVYNEMMDTMGLHVVDVNFDGYKDVIILNNFAGAHGNTWYDCWLWDDKTSTFIVSDSFAEICNPALDPDNKCIYSAGGSGAAYWGGKIYKFIDGEFVVTNELESNQNGLVEMKLENGEMEIEREIQYGEDDQMINNELEYYKNDELWQLDNPRWYRVGGHHADQWLD